MTENVMLACGDRAMALHGNEHDGLPANHPSCVTHAGEAGGLSCKVVPEPDLTGRLAMCADYGKERYKSGPIYPDDKTQNGGMCTAKGCFCLVPSSMSLPFFSSPRPSYDERCAVRVTPPGAIGFDAQGYCTYRESGHDTSRGRGRILKLELITVKYPKGHCGQCGLPIPVGAVAEWGKDSNGHGNLYHLLDQCPALSHKFIARTDLGQDLFYCGCHGWD